VGRLGLAFDGRIWGPLHYAVDADLFLVPDERTSLHVEHSLMVAWEATDWLYAEAGYKLSWGQFPFGEELEILPMADLVFRLAQPGS
jgi:hypothetical protein